MESIIHTGSTQGNASITLFPLSFEGHSGEQAMILLQIHAHPRDAATLRDESVSIVQHALLGSEGESWHRMDGVLKELNGLFKGFLASQAIHDIHAIIAFLDRDAALHVSHAGRGEAYLLRNGHATQITEYVKGKPVPMFVHISTGELEPGDTVICSTQRLLRTFTSAQLAQVIQLAPPDTLRDIALRLESEREHAALSLLSIPQGRRQTIERVEPDLPSPRRRTKQRSVLSQASNVGIVGLGMLGRGIQKAFGWTLNRIQGRSGNVSGGVAEYTVQLKKFFRSFMSDLQHPQRKKRAHLLLIASAVAVFVVLWVLVQLGSVTQRSKTRAQATQILDQIKEELRTAENRRIMGENDAASAILTRAEEQAKQILSSDTGLFRSDALSLLDSIHQKQEELLNIVRVSPRLLVNISEKNPKVAAQGLIGVGDGEFTVFDRDHIYHVLLNTVEEGRQLAEGDAIVDGAEFSRFKSQVFITNGSSVIEYISGQPVVMKTEDATGWASGKDMESYLRYLYVLTTDNRILKYERLNNRYGPSVSYNVNGDLTNSVDMANDGSVYILKQNGTLVKLFRGEAQPFTIHNMPNGALDGVTKFVKKADGNFYFLDPVKKRVLVATDGGSTGESAYVRQYTLEGEMGTLKDVYVDPDESHLYVMDEQRIYISDIVKK